VKIAKVIGTRPQFGKAAVVSPALHQFLGTTDHHPERNPLGPISFLY
jgi:hypothetical protein